jgi:hypothetical protein
MAVQPDTERFDFEGEVEIMDDPKAEFFRHVADLLLHAKEPEIGRPHRTLLDELPEEHRKKYGPKNGLRPATITFEKHDCMFVITEDPTNPRRRTIEIIHPNQQDDFLRYAKAKVEIDLNDVGAVATEDRETPHYETKLRPSQFTGYELNEEAVISPDDLVAIWEIPSGTEIRGSEFPDASMDEALSMSCEDQEKAQ